MPLISIESGKLTKEQKAELIDKITKTASEIMNIPHEFFFVSINELSDENIGIGGKTIEKLKNEYKQKWFAKEKIKL